MSLRGKPIALLEEALPFLRARAGRDAWFSDVRASLPDFADLANGREQRGRALAERVVAEADARRRLRYQYSFAIPTEAAVKAVAALSPLVEMGAGSGYWARLLTDAGADVIAYDNFSWHDDPEPVEGTFKRDALHYPVLEGETSVLAQHSDRSLFLCWPYMDSMAFDCLRTWHGERLAYIGEGEGSCTASPKFFELTERDFDTERYVDLPQWYGLHDGLISCAAAHRAAASLNQNTRGTNDPETFRHACALRLARSRRTVHCGPDAHGSVDTDPTCGCAPPGESLVRQPAGGVLRPAGPV